MAILRFAGVIAAMCGLRAAQTDGNVSPIFLYSAVEEMPVKNQPPIAPLRIGPEGVVLKNGQPYRGIGINYFSAFNRTLDNPEDTSYREGFDELAQRGIPFIRFAACGFWPKNWTCYIEDKEAYFTLMDGLVKAAEEKGLGLIPSLFWYDACVPDLVGEPRGQWGNSDSKTIAFMRQYTREVVTRYLNSPAIWAWEFGNEYNLGADLPNAAEHRPWIHPNLGTPKERSEADDLTHDMIISACREFAKEIRKYDTLRPITCGHSLPRPAAHHMRTEKNWAHDSPEQFAANLLETNPDPNNLISIHVYPFEKGGRFGKKTISYADVLSTCLKTANGAGKALFVGEFGAPDTEKDGGPDTARKNFYELLNAIESTGVPLAALWVFDLSNQDSFINITPTNQRSYQLEEIARANRRLAAKPAENRSP